MPNECPTIDELLILAKLSSTDERCGHLNECPRCQALLLTYNEFLAGKGRCDSHLLEKVNLHLDYVLDQEIFDRNQEISPEITTSFFNWRSPAIRGALATAAVVLLFFSINGNWEKPIPNHNLLRSSRTTQSGIDFLQATCNIQADGGIQWNWLPVNGADSYRIEILDVGFELLASLPVEGDPVLRMSSARLKETIESPGSYFWVIIALQGGDVILRSEPFVFSVGLN